MGARGKGHFLAPSAMENAKMDNMRILWFIQTSCHGLCL